MKLSEALRRALQVTLLTLCWCTGLAQTCGPDGLEPDDGCVLSRTGIQGGTTQIHDFCDDAGDWIAFNACAGRSYTVETSGLGSAADTVLDLYAADCTGVIATDDDGAGGRASRVTWSAPASGTYHVRVRQKDGTSGTNRGYTLVLTGDTTTCGTWDRWYEDSGVTRDVDRGVVGADGGAILGGLTYDDIGRSRTFVVRTGAAGGVVWSKRIEADLIQWPSIAPTDDGGFFFADRLQTDPQSGLFAAWIAKFDAAGSVVWQKQFGGGSSNDEAAQIVATFDGGFALAGRTDGFGSNDTYQPWIMKADATGAVQWSARLGFDDDRATAIGRMHDGGYIVAGDRFDLALNVYQVWVARTDAAGAILWLRSYGGSGNDMGPGSVLESSDGGVLVGAHTSSYSPVAGTGAAWILKLDSGGGIIWQRRYWASPGLSDTPAGDFVTVREAVGGDILFGASLQGGSPQSSWTARINAVGDPVWQFRRTIGLGGVSLKGLDATPDGGAFVFERSSGEGGARRIDPAGSVPLCDPVAPAPSFSYAPTASASTATTAMRKTYSVSVAPTAFALTPLLSADGIRCPCPPPDPGLIASVEKTLAGEVQWRRGPAGLSFDMVRGELGTLRSTTGDFTAALNAVPAGHAVCWTDNSASQYVSETITPATDTGFFVLVRSVAACRATGAYDGVDAKQVGSRNAEIQAAAGTCP